MSLDKKGFAELIENAINECKYICNNSNKLIQNLYLNQSVVNDDEYIYNKCMEKLALAKIKRLYSILSTLAYSRIMNISEEEVEAYRNEKVSELSSLINRQMLAMEVAANNERINIKNSVENLVVKQSEFREMTSDDIKKHLVEILNLQNFDVNDSFDGREENIVLQNIVKDRETLSMFLNMLNDYKKLEKEIKEIRSEQIIIYNDLLGVSIKGDISFDELFSEESLNNLQAILAEKITEISNYEFDLKKKFGSKAKKAYEKIKSYDYRTFNEKKILPYEKSALELFDEIIPSKTIELALLQNDEWNRLNEKVFKTREVSNRMMGLSVEIDDTKKIIDSFIKEWYRNTYYNSTLFGPISSRASGKFEYSLGVRECLDDFINFGIWPEEKEIDSLKKCLKLNRIEAEKSVIYAEQIKERFTRLFNVSLNNKKKELEDLDERITSRFGKWNNDIILSIIYETK